MSRAAAALILAALTGALLPAGLAAQQDPVPADTAFADTVRDARQRAIQRLRALPTSPIQRDTLADDTAGAARADTADGRAATPAESEAARQRRPGADTVVVVAEETPDRRIARDTVLGLLRGLEGYSITDYRGEAAVFEADSNVLRLRGDPRVSRDRQGLETDSLIVYRGETGVVCGYGNPVLTGEGDPVQSAVICYDLERNLGMAEGARTQFTQGATWYVRGAQNRVYMLTGSADNRLYGERTEFTSCDLPEPHYTFRARSLKMVENDVMIARDVTLRFEDVPVFWLPWMVQSMKRDRRSGLLTPQFGVNDIVRNSTGYNRHISNLGFYWAINDYMSAQLTGEWFSNNYTGLTGAFSYRWLEQFLNGQLTVRQFWRESGRRDITVNTNNNWQPDERTRVNLSGSYASSTDFVRRNSFDPHELNRQIASSGSITRSFDWGSANVGAQRRQSLSNDRVDLTLPSASVTISPVTLFSAGGGTLPLTWSGGGDYNRRLIDVPTDTLRADRDRNETEARANHRLGLGRFSISQNASFTDNTLHLLPATEADTALPPATMQEVNWSSSASYQQDLWTGTSLTPRVSVSGRQLRSPRTDNDFLERPVRYDFGAGLNTTVYGFWPGVGPFSAIRHKVSPSIGWNYSPAPPGTTPLQDTIFGASNLREQNRLTLTLNQTFEAKYATADTASADTTAGQAGGPRRLPQARKITLLALNTSASPGFTYDFIARREDGRGFLTRTVRNSIRSDLLRGLQLSTTHDLFREGETPEVGLAPRTFAPHLSNLQARFSIDDQFWLFRFLGISGGEPEDAAEADSAGATGPAGSLDPSIAGETPPGADEERVGSMIGGGRPALGAESGRSGIGGWRASVNYSMVRPRPGTGGQPSQMVSGNISFRPTEHWSVNWSTGYSITNREFSDHFLTLTRDLHRWRANFDFVRAQNGNFAMQFRVQLIDNPDLKLDYDQRTDPSQRAPGPGGTQ